MTNLKALNKILTEKLDGTEEGKTLLDALNLIVKKYGGNGDAVNNAQALNQLYTVFYKGEVLEPYEGDTEITPTLEDNVLNTANKKVESDITVKAVTPVYGTEESPAEYEITEGSESGTVETVITISDTKDKFLTASAKTDGWYKAGVKGLNCVKVGIDARSKARIKPENVRYGVDFLGVYGAYRTAEFATAGFSPSVDSNIGAVISVLDTRYIDFSNISNVSNLFAGMRNLRSVYFGYPNTFGKNFSDFSGLFQGCVNLSYINDISNIGLIRATVFSAMFYHCRSLKKLEQPIVSATGVATDTSYMFASSGVEELDLTMFFSSGITGCSGMFSGCTSLESVLWSSNWMSNRAISNFSVSDCPLSHASCLNLFNNLATRDNSPTLELSSTTKGYMSEEEMAIATGKGWTIA